MKKLLYLIAFCLIATACDSKEDTSNNAKTKGMNIESETVIAVDVVEGENQGQNTTPPVAQQPQAQQNNVSTEEDIQKSTSNIEKDYSHWLRQIAIPNLQKKCAQKGIDLSLPECTEQALFYGDGAVMLAPEHPDWINARSLAYQKALVDAYQKAASYLNHSNQAKLLSEFVEDNEKPQLSENLKSNVDVLFDKAIAYVDGTLNNKLINLGINPNQYNSAAPTVKKEMLKSAITKSSITSALATTTGMIPYQTFEGKNSFGDHIIRVVVSAEPDRIDLLKTMLAKQSRIMPNESKKNKKSLYERLVLNEEILVNQFGTRLMYDEEGYPVLVAFGQAGIENAASSSGRAARVEIAHKKAVSNADALLTLLLNSSTSYNAVTRQVLSHLEEESLTVEESTGNVMNDRQETDTYISAIDSKTSVSGRIQNFAGRSEFYSWNYELPQTKHKVSGVILVWSPKTSQHAQNIKAGKTSPRLMGQPTAGSHQQNGPTNVIRGIESDF